MILHKKIAFWFYKKIINFAKTKIKEPTKDELEKIEKLRKRLDLIKTEKTTENEWVNNQKILLKNIIEKDPRRFLDWDIIRYTMFFNGRYKEYKEIVKDSYWRKNVKVLYEDKIGDPDKYLFFPKSSGNLIHHAYSLNILLKKYGVNIKEQNDIFEFGGGYGSLARLFYKLGYERKYIIYDLPIFSALQEYFLNSLDLNLQTSFNNVSIKGNKRIDLLSDFKKLDLIRNIDIFIGLWSLSECPIDIREKIMSNLPKPKYFLIGFQNRFSGIDNIKYFQEFKERRNDYKWKLEEIKHLKGNFYLVGIKKN